MDTILVESVYTENGSRQSRQETVSLGRCILILSQSCPDSDVNFYLYNRKYSEVPEPIHVGETLSDTNITKSSFNRNLPTKIIIHGYNSDMFLSVLVEIKHQYLIKGDYNIFAVDWGKLAPAPCYPSAVSNSRHVGACTAQLIERLRDLDVTDIHVIGFSLGAHVAGFAANNLRPYKLPRITGLDPAMPLFTFVTRDNKLDETDAEFVDVFHTNAFIQGKIEPSGHVDFYMNGGVTQPGCWAEERFFACNHHRAPLYFAESINSNLGFWGWPCTNFFMYLIGLCPPSEPQILAGDPVKKESRGFHLVITDSVSPYAVGEFTKPMIEIIKKKISKERELYRKEIEHKKLVQYKREILDCDYL
ncbi:phospholipase A1-like [Chrysoperla carnea]|uniref:phospholipase A1-like n=1 Tax=Chrysoperla carnea TaxID=189513 RepID=UPI001D065FCA|nr:phospholipase A1-like [Chrysoperla carnea]